LVGEQSTSVFLTKYPVNAGSIKRQGDQPTSVRIPGRALEGGWLPGQVERALLRFRGSKLTYSGRPPVKFSVYLNLDRPEDATKDHPGYAGQFKKEPANKDDQIILFDVTKVLTSLVKPGDRASFTVILESEGADFSWTSVELAIITKEISG
jgi:hypothetical protein